VAVGIKVLLLPYAFWLSRALLVSGTYVSPVARAHFAVIMPYMCVTKKVPMMSADDESLLAKIQVLLDASHYDEFLLIVLVLLTRVEDAEKVQQVWTRNRDTLDAFCRRLENKPQYLHIVARLVSRLQGGTIGPELFQVLLSSLESRNEYRAPLMALDADLILALNAAATEEHVNEVLDNVWQRFRQVLAGHNAKGQVKVAMLVDTDTPPTKDDADWKLVHATLDALLIADADDVMTSLQQAVLLTFIAHGPKTCSSKTIPSWYKTMVLWLTSAEQGPPSSLLTQWHGVVLQCSRELTLHCPKELQQVLLHNKSISAAVIQLILFYIASSSQQTDAEVALAWTTLAIMVEAVCFDWVMLPGSGALGNATSLCTILRLATGEWRIQLGRFCVDECSENAAEVVESCGRVIVAALHHMVHLAETKKEKFQIQGSALLHLRDSLQDALHSTVQYLCQPQEDVHQEAQAIAGRVFGALLTEFDVWDGLPNGVSTDEILQALSVVLQIAHEKLINALMPSLVAVLGSVEGTGYCVKFLDKHHLLGKKLVNFLVSFWKIVAPKDVSQCAAACQVADLWYSLSTPPPAVTAPLRKAILKWIRKEMESTSPKVSALPSAVDCYVMLFGQDAVPSEREGRVIQRALNMCEAKQSWK